MVAKPVRAPRLNANDDEVKVIDIPVRPSDQVAAENIVAQLETDKATVDVVTPTAGIVLRVDVRAGETVSVGAPIIWIGDSADDVIPAQEGSSPAPAIGATAAATAKAQKLMATYGLRITDFVGIERITERDVEALAQQRGLHRDTAQVEPLPPTETLPAPGTTQPLTTPQRAMMRTVSWHANVPVPAYVEVEFDQVAWQTYARDFASRNRLLFDPVLGLLSHKLCTLAADFPLINGTVTGTDFYRYNTVNLGFTVRSKSNLVMVAVRGADTLDETSFIKELSRLQRAALGERLSLEQITGITMAFTSLQNAAALRHIPILPPHTSLIVAHSAPDTHGRSIFGATYDHRVLDGDTVARVLRLIKPTSTSESS